MIQVTSETKARYRSGNYLNNYIIDFLDESEELLIRIMNDNIVEESCALNESICSGDNLKLGAIEANCFSFECFSTQEKNIEQYKPFIGKKLLVKIASISTIHGSEGEAVLLGLFTIKESSKQASTGVYKIKAYSDFNTKKLDQDVTGLINTLKQQGEKYNVGISSYNTSMFYIYESVLKYCGLKSEEGEPMVYPGTRTITQAEDSGVTYQLYNNLKSQQGSVKVYYRAFEIESSRPLYRMYELKIKTYLFVKELNNNLYNYLNQSLSEGYIGTTQAGTNYLFSITDIIKNDSMKYPYAESVTVEYQKRKEITKYFRCLAEYIYYNNDKTQSQRVEDGYYLDSYDVYRTAYHKATEANLYITLPYKYEVTLNGNTEVFNIRYDITTALIDSAELDYEKTPATIGQNAITNSTQVSNVTARDVIESYNEGACRIAKTSRSTGELITLDIDYNSLTPQDTLYPENTLYPGGSASYYSNSMYSKLWYEESNNRKVKNLIFKYKKPDGTDNTKTYLVNEDGTDDYTLSNNFCIKFIASDEMIDLIAEDMVQKLKVFSWFPFDMECIGLPYIEAGDVVEIHTEDGAYTTHILTRELKGIHNLNDKMKNGNVNIY